MSPLPLPRNSVVVIESPRKVCWVFKGELVHVPCMACQSWFFVSLESWDYASREALATDRNVLCVCRKCSELFLLPLAATYEEIGGPA